MTATDRPRPSFGIKTAPQGEATYEPIRRVWQEADALPEIADAWLWDHLLPLGLDPDQPCLENWTVLAALAAQTTRLRLGHLVTNNLMRHPAVLAKMAATVDVISGGRLVLGIGAGGAGPEQEAYGMPLLRPAQRIQRLAEACAIVKRMWTEDGVDFAGRHYVLKGARCEPKPIQRPHPPLLIGGRGEQLTLRVVAEHADVWNLPGWPPGVVDDFRRLNAALDAHCAAISRDPAAITRSVQVHVDRNNPGMMVETVCALVRLGASHVVLNLQPPYPPGVATWLVESIVRPAVGRLQG